MNMQSKPMESNENLKGMHGKLMESYENSWNSSGLQRKSKNSFGFHRKSKKPIDFNETQRMPGPCQNHARTMLEPCRNHAGDHAGEILLDSEK